MEKRRGNRNTITRYSIKSIFRRYNNAEKSKSNLEQRVNVVAIPKMRNDEMRVVLRISIR